MDYCCINLDEVLERIPFSVLSEWRLMKGFTPSTFVSKRILEEAPYEDNISYLGSSHYGIGRIVNASKVRCFSNEPLAI